VVRDVVRVPCCVLYDTRGVGTVSTSEGNRVVQDLATAVFAASAIRRLDYVERRRSSTSTNFTEASRLSASSRRGLPPNRS